MEESRRMMDNISPLSRAIRRSRGLSRAHNQWFAAASQQLLQRLNPTFTNSRNLRVVGTKITGLDLRNFRGFDNTRNEIPFSKVNLVFGPNSGGKSSILKALASFPQTLNENRSNVEIDRFSWVTTGPWFDLGDAESVIHKASKRDKQENDGEFSIGFMLTADCRQLVKSEFVFTDTNDENIEVQYNTYTNDDDEEMLYLFNGSEANFDAITERQLDGFLDPSSDHFLAQKSSPLSKSKKANLRKSILASNRRHLHGILRLNNLIDQWIPIFPNAHTISFIRKPAIVRHIRDLEFLIEDLIRRADPHQSGDSQDFQVKYHTILKMQERLHHHIRGLHHFRFHGSPQKAHRLLEKRFVEIKNQHDQIEHTIRTVFEAHLTEDNKDSLRRFREHPAPKGNEKTLADSIRNDFGMAKITNLAKGWKLNYHFEFANQEDHLANLKRITLEAEDFGEYKKIIGFKINLDLDDGDGSIEIEPDSIENLVAEADKTIFVKSKDYIEEKIQEFVGTQDKDRQNKIKIFINNLHRDDDPDTDESSEDWIDSSDPIHKLQFLPNNKFFQAINYIITDEMDWTVPSTPRQKDQMHEIFNDIITKKQKEELLKMLEQANSLSLKEDVKEHFQVPKKIGRKGFSIISKEYYDLPTKIFDYNVNELIDLCGDFSGTISEFTKNMDYLGANRLSPQRHFNKSRSSSNRIGNRGIKSIVNLFNTINPNKKKQKTFNKLLDHVVGKHAKFESIPNSGGLFKVMISSTNTEDGIELNLADVGYGVSQCIPLLGSTMTTSTLLCEEAESNLHPAAQARLMECLLDSYAKRDDEMADNMPLIVLETHSEHFLKALLNHLEKGEGLKDEDVSILYVDKQEGKTVVKRIRTEDGEFVDPWPRDRWYDETNPII